MLKSKVVKIILGIFIFLLVLITSTVIIYQMLLGKTSKDTTPISFSIEYNTTSQEVLENLKEKDLIKNVFAAKVYMKLNHITNIQAGDYVLHKAMGAKEILKSLGTGKVVGDQITVTFVEGKRIPYYVNVIAKNFPYEEKEINKVLNDKEFLQELIDKYWFITSDILNKDIYYPLEGYFFPDTYNFYKDATIKDIILTLINGLESKLNPYRQDIEKADYTIHELLTLASMVELEGVDDSSRNSIAGVFYNRIKDNWTLGSDVTTYYAFKKDFSVELTNKEYNTCNPYNTRSNCFTGLPVGPIASSGLESLKATIYPTDTDAYYFVADKNKKTYFAKTYQEFEAIQADLKQKGLWYTYN